MRRNHQAGQIVIRKRRMAVVSKYQHFVLARSTMYVFGQGQAAWAELRANDDAVPPLGH